MALRSDLSTATAVEVPLGTRAVVVGPLLLGPEATESSASLAGEVGRMLDAWDGPGVVVFAGDLFDLLHRPDPSAALRSHPELARPLGAFATRPGRRVISLPGLRDARLGWDRAARSVLAESGVEVAALVDLLVDSAAGERRVRVQPGREHDPRAAPGEGAGPGDTPLAHHLLSEVLPGAGSRRLGWLEGIDRLTDPAALSRFVVSRLFYRKVARYAWWLLVPLLAAVLFKLPLAYLIPLVGRRAHASAWPVRVAVVGATTLVDVALVVVAVAILSRRVWATVAGFSLGEGPAAGAAGAATAMADGGPGAGPAANDVPRGAARELVMGGLAGLVTAHTLAPELTTLGPGFYANCGSAAAVVVERPARLALPSVFVTERQLCWIELEGGAELHVRLLRSASTRRGASLA
ncbi:MAG: hypothetical protein ACRD0L_02215, partial [Acidimicrobiales bacterium]